MSAHIDDMLSMSLNNVKTMNAAIGWIDSIFTCDYKIQARVH
jgi:hypothetical protein